MTTFTTLRHDLLAPGLATFLLVLMSYIAGRVHQFFKQTTEREQAFREGYNKATRSLFSLATQTAVQRGAADAPAPKTAPMKGFASVPLDTRDPVPAKHRAVGRRRTNLADTRRFTTPVTARSLTAAAKLQVPVSAPPVPLRRETSAAA